MKLVACVTAIGVPDWRVTNRRHRPIVGERTDDAMGPPCTTGSIGISHLPTR